MRNELLIRMALMALPVFLGACSSEEKVDDAKQAISGITLDPAAVQFRSVSLSQDGKFVCGEVNSKNFYGGYVGFQPFSYEISTREPVIWGNPSGLESERRRVDRAVKGMESA